MPKTTGLSIPINQYGDMIITNEQGQVRVGVTLTTGTVRKYFRTITGKEEVRQALMIRLLTRLGEDILEPGYGLPIRAIIHVNDDDFTRSSVEACVLQDPRVKSVSGIQLTRVPATAQMIVRFVAILKDTTTLTFEETFNL